MVFGMEDRIAALGIAPTSKCANGPGSELELSGSLQGAQLSCPGFYGSRISCCALVSRYIVLSLGRISY